SPAEATNYRRDLDLDTGITTVQYTFAGKTYRREVFANYPSNVIVIRLTGGDYQAGIKSAHGGTTTPEYIEGAIPGGAIRYAARYVTVREKDGVTLILSAATNFKSYQDVSGDPRDRLKQ